MVRYEKGKYSTCTFINDDTDMEKDIYPFRIDVSIYALPKLLRLLRVGISFTDVKGKWNRTFKFKNNKLSQSYCKNKRQDYISPYILEELENKINEVINSSDYKDAIARKTEADFNRSKTQILQLKVGGK